MIIDEEVMESSVAVSAARRRPNRRRTVVIGAATLLVAGATLIVAVTSGGSDSRDAPRTTVDPTAQDAVNEQANAEPTQIEAPRSRDDAVRDLVERGLVPAATLDDGTQITRRDRRP